MYFYRGDYKIRKIQKVINSKQNFKRKRILSITINKYFILLIKSHFIIVNHTHVYISININNFELGKEATNFYVLDRKFI